MLPLAIVLSGLLACRQAPAETETDTREPIAIAYVGAPELKVHARSDAASPVVATFLNGESVSVLARRGEWTEIRTGAGSGWVLEKDLTNAAGATAEEENPTPRFRVAPSAVAEPGAHGTIYLEADVNTEGEVTAVTIVTNTTGSAALAAKNVAALQRAKFYPIVRKGEKKAFKYDYRVDY
jgi:TonB family protein